MFERFIRWLFPSLYRGHFETLHKIREDLAVLLAGMRRIESQPPRVLRRVYVTLRGVYKISGKEVAHAWTQSVDLEEGETCSMPFQPYNMFKTERVDILGPAVIAGVGVGNMAQTHPKFEAPTTFEFETEINVGNQVVVYLKGTP